MATNTVSAYSGYTFTLPDKLTLSMTTSFETNRSYNYGPSINFEIGDRRISISYDDLLDLNDEIQKMLDLAKSIPHTENVNGFYR
jgi:hypothetical protein